MSLSRPPAAGTISPFLGTPSIPDTPFSGEPGMAARSIATLALGLFLGLIMGPSAVGDDKKDDKAAAPKAEDKQKPAEGKTMELPKGTKGEIAVMETSQG